MSNAAKGSEESSSSSHAREFARILEAPHQLSSWVGNRDYRRLVLERFPYMIIFKYDDAEVLIVAFAHGRRKPGYWRR